MRTTIDLPEDLHRVAASVARDKRQTLSQAVADIMRRGLDQPNSDEIVISPITGFPTIRVGRPITNDDIRALDDDE
ncbi:MAG: antitoxin [Pseudonocardiales bacterium]|nr:MAG: antitoxin [Pseudonocardiales bacterium]